MSFVAVRFDVEAADADRWSDALLDEGALSVEAIDPRAGTADETAVFGEPADASPAWWPVTRLTALCGAGVDPFAVVRAAAHAVCAPMPVLDTYAIPDQDWVRATQAQFRPIRIRDDFWVVPSWCTPPRPDALNLVLDPGLAFGTGAHPTTRLCLLWLADNVTSDASVLDYGCGSGILAIAAAKLGAAAVTGVDIDPQAIRASAANARANGVHAEFALVDALARQRFSLVVANILANPLRLIAPALAERTQACGRIALSGILAAQAGGVIDAYAPWFDMRVAKPCDESIAGGGEGDHWVLLSGVLRASSACAVS
jgi:ribosomal protein L11 methyltransferase